jgi:hypothetical protein
VVLHVLGGTKFRGCYVRSDRRLVPSTGRAGTNPTLGHMQERKSGLRKLLLELRILGDLKNSYRNFLWGDPKELFGLSENSRGKFLEEYPSNRCLAPPGGSPEMPGAR